MMKRKPWKAVILDMDGVITQTAQVHARAWKSMFDEYLEQRSSRGDDVQEPFDIQRDYRQYVDGKSRNDGVRSFLESRGIQIPDGDQSDESNWDSIAGLGNRKNSVFHDLLQEEGVEVYEDTVEQIQKWKRQGLKIAVISSSRNCEAVLQAVSLLDTFDAKVDGNDVAELGLSGKPSPDIFLRAAQELGVEPSEAMVIEDAIAGVEAGRRGKFGMVVGVARGREATPYRQAGADRVVADLRELDMPDDKAPDEGSQKTPASALEQAAEIAERLDGKQLALFLDYDGTLTPIVRRAEDAILSQAMRSLLSALAEHCTVAIVSGRDRRDAERMVQLEDLVYAGSHGFDIHGPDGLEMQHQDARRLLPELDAAEEEHLACEAGFRGAMYPWQSGSSGREESQVLHLNPKSGEWQPDDTHRQRHVNAAIAYNICRYFQATGDIEFLSFYGAEMLLEIARFWASIATYNAQRDRYEIHHVVGPDEFHTHYPDSDGPGLNNNAYTNVMAVWVLCFARRALELLSEERKRELTTQLGIDDEELERWDKISRKMFVPFHDDGILTQFEGYESLEEFDWEGYREKHGDIQRLDRILKAEGDTPNRYKASKQADALMLFYLFSCEELRTLFDHLDYPFDPDMIPRNIRYYMARTSHGSTLSRVVHAWVLARSDRQKAWELFRQALESDVADIQGGTTSEGIHLGAMAGTVDIIQRCHTGLEMRDSILWFNPCLPEQLDEIHLRIRYRGHWLRVQVTGTKLAVRHEHSRAGSVQIGFRDQIETLAPGENCEWKLGAR